MFVALSAPDAVRGAGHRRARRARRRAGRAGGARREHGNRRERRVGCGHRPRRPRDGRRRRHGGLPRGVARLPNPGLRRGTRGRRGRARGHGRRARRGLRAVRAGRRAIATWSCTPADRPKASMRRSPLAGFEAMVVELSWYGDRHRARVARQGLPRAAPHARSRRRSATCPHIAAPAGPTPAGCAKALSLLHESGARRPHHRRVGLRRSAAHDGHRGQRRRRHVVPPGALCCGRLLRGLTPPGPWSSHVQRDRPRPLHDCPQLPRRGLRPGAEAARRHLRGGRRVPPCRTRCRRHRGRHRPRLRRAEGHARPRSTTRTSTRCRSSPGRTPPPSSWPRRSSTASPTPSRAGKLGPGAFGLDAGEGDAARNRTSRRAAYEGRLTSPAPAMTRPAGGRSGHGDARRPGRPRDAHRRLRLRP